MIDFQRLQNERTKGQRALTPGFSDFCIQDSELRVDEDEEQFLKPNKSQIKLSQPGRNKEGGKECT